MAKVSVSLDAELVVEVMVLAGAGSPQDAVELVIRDYIERGHRTEAHAEQPARRLLDDRAAADTRDTQGG
ncbi:DUF2191 domain-containing protein [Streptomyces sp. DSM 44917]|uniref:DUF2191 domain-containing protein n=1 Tax=Streptomyces boetiae TaxID=3075541 RepID=A0ABU2L2R4_9ACTN|nr:DUF2191 domain-containing protein [Streptomyces sp. DSM 44917]MDT0305696.1 DUF2191 domain-containing protein [Streptomyces sp. DSM 44917]